MFVMERGGELWLAPFITNNWLKDGMVVEVKNALTESGNVAFRIESRVAEGQILATIEPPRRNLPTSIVLRLRHPDGKRIKSVRVNGELYENFDSKRKSSESLAASMAK